MENIYFKLLGMKVSDEKMIIVAVVDQDFIGKELPGIFELQAVKVAPTIFTGGFPTIKMNIDTIKDVTKKFTGHGLAGIMTSNDWYCQKTEVEDALGISIKERS